MATYSSKALLLAGLGFALAVAPPLGAQEPAAAAEAPVDGTVRGVVHDSTAAVPLEGATVLLLGTAETAITGADGTFRFDAVPPGVYRITFFHPRLDELGLGSAAWEVEVEPDAAAETELWIPSAASLAEALCRSEPGVLVGVLREEEGGPGVEGSVTARWTGEGGERMSATATDERGRYALCGLPVGAAVRVRGVADGSVGTAAEVRLPRTGLLARDVALDVELEELEVEEPAILAGRIVEMEDGSPVEGAEVRIEGAARVATSDAAGRFQLPSVPAGRRALEVEHLSFGVHTDTVELEPGATLRVQIEVPPRAVELEGLEVTAERRYRGRMSGFEERMERGRGEFVTREQIARRENQPLPRIISSRSNSLRLACPSHPGRNPTGTVGRCWLENRRAMRSLQGPSACPMEYWLDGSFLSSGFDITQLDPHDVEAIEIYPGPSTIPVRFKVGSANCGVVVIWTREAGGEPSS